MPPPTPVSPAGHLSAVDVSREFLRSVLFFGVILVPAVVGAESQNRVPTRSTEAPETLVRAVPPPAADAASSRAPADIAQAKEDAQSKPPGQEKAATDGEPGEKKRLSLRDVGIKGDIVYKNFDYARDMARDGNFENEGIVEVEWQRQFFGHRFKFVGVGRNDDTGKDHGFHEKFPDTRFTRSVLAVKESVLSLDLAPFRVNLGKQLYTWGTGDAYNPTDNLNPWDFLDPIDREKMAVWSAAITTDYRGVNLQFVAVPLFTPDREPLQNSRWVVTSSDSGAATIAVPGSFGPLPPGAGAALAGATPERKRKLPPDKFESGQFGFRAKTTLLGWDLSASYYDGFDPSPVLFAGHNTRLGETELVYTRIKAPGADFSTTWKKFEFHGENVAKFSEARGPVDRWHGVVGLNYTLDELGVSWLEQIVFVLEHARETILQRRVHPEYSEPTGLSSAFRNALILRMLVRFNQDTEFSAGAVVDVDHDPNFVDGVKLTHKFADWLHVDLGLTFFGGKQDTFWGRWHRNDRFFFTAKYFF